MTQRTTRSNIRWCAAVVALGMAALVHGGCVDYSGSSGSTDARGSGAGASSNGAGSSSTGDQGSGGVRTESSGLVIHEWGTFTSVQDSQGRVLEGLHHEEESLPPFVHGRLIGSPGTKSIEYLPEGVTQKLETPVIYFYSAEERTVKVEVDFPQGIISQWYPAARSFAPEIGSLERMGDGKMMWEAKLVTGSMDVPWVPEEDVWAPSRRVASTPLQVDNEPERFIFYRGLGRFEVPFQVTSVGTTMTLRNLSQQRIPAVFLLHVHEEGGSVTDLGALEPGGSTTSSPSPKEDITPDYLARASDMVAAALVETGLYEDEAAAMVDTWQRSYFLNRGLRVLYIVPEAWTSQLLPMRLDPQPDELVRTLVGRVEVITETDEVETAQALEAAAAAGQYPSVEQFGRFAEPRLRRAMELVEGQAARDLCQQLINEATVMP